MTSAPPPPSALPSEARRLVVYVVYDVRGELGDYIPHALRALRPHAAHILAVVNGRISAEGRLELDAVADEIIVRPNTGFDVEAQREALAHLGDRILEFDEIVLTNDTWYGPVRPFAPVFERMDATPLHLWGMTEHPASEGDPVGGRDAVPWHLQSYWLAVRRPVLASSAWAQYWRDLPAISTYDDAVRQHELRFAQWFRDEGFSSETAFAAEEYSGDNPAIFHADLLMRDGCPLLKRRLFFHHPTFMVRYAVIARDVLRTAVEFGYPARLLYRDLARNVAPRTLHAALASLEVRRATHEHVDASATLLVESARASTVADVVRTSRAFPPDTSVVLVAAPDEEPELLHVAWSEAGGVAEPVVFPATHSAEAFRATVDRAVRGAHDTFVHVDASLWGADGVERRFLREQQVGSLLGGADPVGYLASLLRRRPEVGLILPTEAYAGALPQAIRWQERRDAVRDAAALVGILVPTDEFGPLAPSGGLWAARPSALVGPAQDPRMDADVRRLLLAQAVGEEGFIAVTVATPENVARSHTTVEYALDRLLETTFGYRLEQIQFLQRIGWRGRTRPADLLRMAVRADRRAAGHPALRMARFVRALMRRVARVASS